MPEPCDIDRCLADPKTYESVIMRIFEKRRQRGAAFNEVADGVSYLDTATNRRSLSKTIARTVSEGRFQPQPVELWTLETKGKKRAAHMPGFVDHVVGSVLYQLLSRNAQCYGLPGVYSYLPGLSNVTAMRALAAYIREHRSRSPRMPLYVLQSDFDHYGDGLPIGPDAPLWPVLRKVAGLGSPSGAVSPNAWDLITALARPVVLDSDGAQFTRLYGVAMGTPLVPLLSNLAVAPMDQAIVAINGIFYARFNDDFIIAHPDLDAIHEADERIDALTADLGVRRKIAKELRTALAANGVSSIEDPAYRGGVRIDCLGLSVTASGTTTVGPHRLRRFMGRFTARIDGAAKSVAALPPDDRARQLVAATNVMLDVGSPFAIPGLPALLDSTTDRGVLKDMDFRIARKIVQVATKRPGVRGFRRLPPARLYDELGLVSLVALRNLR